MNRLFAGISLILSGASWTQTTDAAQIACVGDSITFGYGLNNPSTESYPAVLQELLGPDHAVGNFGVSGATLQKSGDKPYWNESAFIDSDAFTPDFVIVMLGTNDAKPGNWSQNASFAADYQELIDHYRALGAVVYVATPPRVFGAGAFEISPTVVESEVAPLVKQLAASEDAPLIDVLQATQLSEALFPDTVHPNAAGARLIAETVQGALIENGFDAPDAMGAGGRGEDVASGGSDDGGGADGSGGQPGSGGQATENGGGGADAPGGGAPSSGGSSSVDTASGGRPAETPGGGGPTDGGGPSEATSGGTDGADSTPNGEPIPETEGRGCQFGVDRRTPGTLALFGLLLTIFLWRVQRRSRSLSN